MKVVDLMVLALLAWGVRQGWRRGVRPTVPGAVSVMVFFFSGVGLFSVIRRGLGEVSAWAGQSLGVFTFVGLLVATYLVWRRFHERLAELAEGVVVQRWQRPVGAVAGGLRMFFWAAIVVIVMAHGPVRFLTRGVVTGTWFGEGVLKVFAPVYQRAHNGR